MKIKGQGFSSSHSPEEKGHPSSISCQPLSKKTLKELKTTLSCEFKVAKDTLKKFQKKNFSNLSANKELKKASSEKIRPKNHFYHFKSKSGHNLNGRAAVLKNIL